MRRKSLKCMLVGVGLKKGKVTVQVFSLCITGIIVLHRIFHIAGSAWKLERNKSESSVRTWQVTVNCRSRKNEAMIQIPDHK